MLHVFASFLMVYVVCNINNLGRIDSGLNNRLLGCSLPLLAQEETSSALGRAGFLKEIVLYGMCVFYFIH